MDVGNEFKPSTFPSGLSCDTVRSRRGDTREDWHDLQNTPEIPRFSFRDKRYIIDDETIKRSHARFVGRTRIVFGITRDDKSRAFGDQDRVSCS